MNILFVHEVDWENKVVFDFHSLSELLASFGHSVFIIDFEAFQKGKKLYNVIKTRSEVISFTGRSREDTSITIIRPALIKAPFLDRASAFITHYLAIERVIKKDDIDAIVLYSVPTNGYQVIRLAKKYNIPVIFRSIDVLHQLVPSRLFKAPTFSLETYVYNNCDKIMPLSPKLSEYVIRMKAPREKVELLPLGVDLNKFNPSVKCELLRDRLKLANTDFVILFIGTLYEFSGLDIYLEAFPEVVKKLPNARLLVVGGGSLLESLKNRSAELGLSKNVLFTGFQSFKLMPQFVNLANLCINPFRLTEATKEIIPGKIIQYLACSKPVLATPLPGMTSQIKGTQHGIFYCQLDEFANNTIRLLTDKNLSKELGAKGYQYVIDNHNEIVVARKLESTILEEIKRKKNKC